MLTPKRPDATCLMRERRSSAKRAGSSPPSPVFERPPMRFIATASVSCASRESDPSDIAPVENRLTISAAGSTSSSGIGSCARNVSRPRSVERRADSSFTSRRELLVCRPAAAAHRVLQQRDRLGVPAVMLAVAAPRVQADHRQQLVGRARDTRAHAARARLGELEQADAADSRRRAGEAAARRAPARARPPRRPVHRSTTRASRCPSSRSSSAAPCRSPAARARSASSRSSSRRAVGDELADRREHQVRIHCGSAVADQHGDALDAARLARLDDESRLQARARADEMVMHRADREQRRHRDALGTRPRGRRGSRMFAPVRERRRRPRRRSARAPARARRRLRRPAR